MRPAIAPTPNEEAWDEWENDRQLAAYESAQLAKLEDNIRRERRWYRWRLAWRWLLSLFTRKAIR